MVRKSNFAQRLQPSLLFYDVSGTTVEILAIVTKSETEVWLAQFANPE